MFFFCKNVYLFAARVLCSNQCVDSNRFFAFFVFVLDLKNIKMCIYNILHILIRFMNKILFERGVICDYIENDCNVHRPSYLLR